MSTDPKWRRRSAERPAEITRAALTIFAERGYATARMADIAALAGLSKAALFTYFPTKAALFRAVASEGLALPVDAAALAALADAPLDTVVAVLLARIAAVLEQDDLRKLARTVIAESGNFPELAQTWHETVVGPAFSALSGAIAAAQARGEARSGDPRLLAMTVIGPMLGGLLWREVMEPVGGEPVDFAALAAEHRTTLLQGLRAS